MLRFFNMSSLASFFLKQTLRPAKGLFSFFLNRLSLVIFFCHDFHNHCPFDKALASFFRVRTLRGILSRILSAAFTQINSAPSMGRIRSSSRAWYSASDCVSQRTPRHSDALFEAQRVLMLRLEARTMVGSIGNPRHRSVNIGPVAK